MMITFSATAANHLGLVAAAENVIHHSLPIVNCPKCAAFWSVLAYSIAASLSSLAPAHSGESPSPLSSLAPAYSGKAAAIIAAALLAAWAAVWLDLLMGIVDNLYIKIYDKIYPTANKTDTDALSTDNTVSHMPVG